MDILSKPVFFNPIRAQSSLEFLTQSGLSYSIINSARLAMSQDIMLRDNHSVDFDKHPLTVKFMKGVFQLRPPRYKTYWNMQIVLSNLGFLNNRSCSFKQFTPKCIMLFALPSEHRVQMLAALTLSAMKRSLGKIVCGSYKFLRTTWPGSNEMIEMFRFSDAMIFPLAWLETCMEQSESLHRGTDSSFLSFVKPHTAVTTQTIRQ